MSNFQVFGQSGVTRPCLIALDMVLSGPLDPQRATVITKEGDTHLLLLWECGNWPFEGFIIPNGFKSGYGGEGARGFSLALCMLYEHHIPIDRLEVKPQTFSSINRGEFPEQWQERIKDSASECEMPIPGWIFVNHWELTKNRRLWRVQWWRGTGIEWPGSGDKVDDFNWVVGDKLHHTCSIIKKNAPSEIFQQAGLVLRDAWIEFSHIIRERIREIPEKPGKNDVKAVIDALNLSDLLKDRAKKAFSTTLDLQHDRNATIGQASDCFTNSVESMAEIVSACFPGQFDPKKDELIRPN